MKVAALSNQPRGMLETGLSTALRLVLFACPLVILAILLWASDRGFDITDEGYYLLSAKSPGTVLGSSSFAYIYVAPIFHLVGNNIIALRIVGYVFVVLSSCVLWAGMRAILGVTVLGGSRDQFLDDIAGLALIIAGSLLIYVLFLITPSYNLLNAAGVNFFGGAILAGLACVSGGRQRLAYVLLLAAGCALGFCVFVKFPTGILLALLAVAGAFFWPATKLRTKLLLIFCLTAGLLLWCLFHFVALQPPQTVYLLFKRDLDTAFVLDTRYTMSSVVTRTLTDIWQLVRDTLRKYSWLCSSAIICVMILKIAGWLRTKNVTRLSYLLPGAAVILSILIFINGWFWGGTRGIYSVSSTLYGFIIIGLLWTSGRVYVEGKCDAGVSQSSRIIWSLALLFFIALPFVQAEGTNNFLYINMVFGMGPWAAALWMMFRGTTNTTRLTWPQLTIPTLFGTLIVILVISGCLYYPYRLVKPLAAQLVPTPMGDPPTILRLDTASSAFFVALNRTSEACGIRSKSHILGFYDVPGIVFALGAESAGAPWYNGGYPGSLNAADRILSWVPRKDLQGAFVIITGTDAIPDLHAYGMDFPEGYRLCSELQTPYNTKNPLEIWKPR